MKVVVSEFMSLDGVVQAPGGVDEDPSGGFQYGGWSRKYFDPEVMDAVIDGYAAANEVLLQGRRTYQVSSTAWPTRSGDAFSDWINAAPKYVVSDTLTEADVTTWKPTEIIRSADLVETVADMRARSGGNVYIYGSLTVARTLIASDQVDELVLFIEPITLGGGKTLFPNDAVAREFELLSVERAKTGVLACRYSPVRTA